MNLISAKLKLSDHMDKYKYLGQTMFFGNGTKNEVKIRKAAV